MEKLYIPDLKAKSYDRLCNRKGFVFYLFKGIYLDCGQFIGNNLLGLRGRMLLSVVIENWLMVQTKDTIGIRSNLNLCECFVMICYNLNLAQSVLGNQLPNTITIPNIING